MSHFLPHEECLVKGINLLSKFHILFDIWLSKITLFWAKYLSKTTIFRSVKPYPTLTWSFHERVYFIQICSLD